jgi:hypothetical protein
VRDRLPFVFEDLGAQRVKNIARPVRVYPVRAAAPKAPTPPALPLPDKPSIAVLPFNNMSGEPVQDYFAEAGVIRRRCNQPRSAAHLTGLPKTLQPTITICARFHMLQPINGSLSFKGSVIWPEASSATPISPQRSLALLIVMQR